MRNNQGKGKVNEPKISKKKTKAPTLGSKPDSHVNKKPLHPKALEAQKANKKQINQVRCSIRLEFPKARIANLLGRPSVDQRVLRKLIGFDTFDDLGDKVGFEKTDFVRKGTSANEWIASNEKEILQIQSDINTLLELNDSYGESSDEVPNEENQWNLSVNLDARVNTPNTLNVINLQTDTANSLRKLIDGWLPEDKNPPDVEQEKN